MPLTFAHIYFPLITAGVSMDTSSGMTTKLESPTRASETTVQTTEITTADKSNKDILLLHNLV
jgi:hypothetical protein